MSRAYGKRTPRGLADLISTPPQDGNEGGEQAGEQALNLNSPAQHSQAGVLESEGAGQPSEGRGWYRGIPGGQNHIGNPPAVRQAGYSKPAEWPYRGTLLAHGVDPDDHGLHNRDPRLSGVDGRDTGHAGRAPHAAEAPAPQPVPVYIVEMGGGRDPLAVTATKRMTLPAAGNEPVQIIDANESRSLVQLLNEDSAHHARIGQLGDLAFDAQNSVIVGGSRLPANATSYMILRTQGPLWAVSESSNTVAISVVTEFQIANAG